jgi:hypothetical protein
LGGPDGDEPHNLSVSETKSGFEIIASKYWEGDDQENFEFAKKWKK